jgi:hypothetical protein
LGLQDDLLLAAQVYLGSGSGHIGAGSAQAYFVRFFGLVEDVFGPPKGIGIHGKRGIGLNQVEIRKGNIQLNIVRNGLRLCRLGPRQLPCDARCEEGFPRLKAHDGTAPFKEITLRSREDHTARILNLAIVALVCGSGLEIGQAEDFRSHECGLRFTDPLACKRDGGVARVCQLKRRGQIDRESLNVRILKGRSNLC